MPTYEYQCFACDHKFEASQKMSEDPISVCPSCGDTEQVRRLVSASSFHLKGSGWYKTDYGSSASSASSTPNSSDKSESKESKKETTSYSTTSSSSESASSSSSDTKSS